MQYEKKKVKITGVCPLVLHNIRLSDPLDGVTRAIKEISSKKKKTDADHEQMAKLEFEGSLYLNEDAKIIVPGINIEALIQDGAKQAKRGKEAKAGVLVEDDPVLKYDGPSDLVKLWADKRFVLRAPVRVQQARVMRTRPQFPVWSLEFTVSYLPDVLNWGAIAEALIIAGQLKGLGDWRPRFGRFTVAA